MYLDYIEITNFRPYYGTQKINFGFNQKENLTIILADNGSGKTSLVNALTWCLYGDELHDVRDKSEPLYNLKAAEIAEKDESINEISVQVKIRFYYFEDEEKKYLNICRSLSFHKWGDADWESAFEDHLIVEESGSQPLEDDFAQDEIDNKIPENMFQYFFFNGATLSNYFKSDSELNLKTSVEDISQVGLINDLDDHLMKTFNTINKRYDKKKPDGHKNYNKIIESKLSEKSELKNKVDENYKLIDEAMELVRSLDDKLTKADSDHVKELTDNRKQLEQQKESLKRSNDRNKLEYESVILDLFPITVLFDELVESLKIADGARKTKTAPPLIEKTLLKDIIKDGYCICGVKLEDHPECLEELEKRMEKTSEVQNDTFYTEYNEIQKVLSKLKDLPKIQSLREDITTSEIQLKNIEKSIDDISNELINIDIKDISLFEEQRDKNKKKAAELRRANANYNSKIDRLDNEINQLKEERERSEKLEGELKELEDKIKFCENAIEIITNLNSNVQQHIREKVNNKTREQFINIDWDYNKYTDVLIEDDYKIKITKSSGKQVRPGDLSDGEENLLALSFMMALHSLSGFEIPLIIDAPLEKLDKGKRIDFISDLHKYTKDKQIVFLFTDSQYTEDVRAHMLENIVDEYELKQFKDKTEIVKHG